MKIIATQHSCHWYAAKIFLSLANETNFLSYYWKRCHCIVSIEISAAASNDPTNEPKMSFAMPMSFFQNKLKSLDFSFVCTRKVAHSKLSEVLEMMYEVGQPSRSVHLLACWHYGLSQWSWPAWEHADFWYLLHEGYEFINWSNKHNYK